MLSVFGKKQIQIPKVNKKQKHLILRILKQCSKFKKKLIRNIQRKDTICFKVINLLFIAPNKKYDSFFISLFASYLVLSVPAFVKLIRMVLLFPGNKFYTKLVFLILFFCFSICAGFWILIERLSADLYKKRLLSRKLSRVMTDYKLQKQNYFQNKSIPNCILLEKIRKTEAKLSRCSTKVNAIDSDPLRTSLPGVFKQGIFIFLLLVVNRHKPVLFVLMSVSEFSCWSLLYVINTVTVSLLCISKELFTFCLFVFMCTTKEMKGGKRLDYSLDILAVVYFILYWTVTFLIYKRVKLTLPPKIK